MASRIPTIFYHSIQANSPLFTFNSYHAILKIEAPTARGTAFLFVLNNNYPSQVRYALVTSNHIIASLDPSLLADTSCFSEISGRTWCLRDMINIMDRHVLCPSDSLDFTFLELDRNFVGEMTRVGMKFLSSETPKENQPVLIAQFPGNSDAVCAQGKVKSIQNGGRVIHTVTTMQGSSGAPLINEQGRVVGIHQGELADRSNVAISINAVIDFIGVSPFSRMNTPSFHIERMPVSFESDQGMQLDFPPI